MLISNPQRAAELRRVIDEFLASRLNDKLDKIKDDDSNPDVSAAKRTALQDRFDPKAWIGDAASRIVHLQSVTHLLKATNPKARGTSLYISPAKLHPHREVGSHCLGSEFVGDIAVDDAKHLDVSAFLKLEFEGRTLLALMLVGDHDLPAALSDDAGQAAAWIDAFSGITQPRDKSSSHTLAKQLYWLTGGDPSDDGGYHLLAPLFATSLTHRAFQTIYADRDRFSDATQDARRARKEGLFTDYVLHDYPNLAVQTLGGTQPQNISQLNSERRGDNYLLASLPPRWKSIDLKPLLNIDSMFHLLGRRPEVKQGVKALLGFLKSDPASNLATRERRDQLAADLVGELLVFSAEIRTLPPGWSQSLGCRLSPAEKHWLDPQGLADAARHADHAMPSDSAEQISQAFARWLNRQLRDPLPMGDPEYLHWCALVQGELDAEEWEVSHAT